MMKNMIKKNLVIFSGAGLDAESGISTFRDKDGLWEKYPIEEIATSTAIKTNLPKVLEFYNLRKQNVLNAAPNQAHYNLKTLEEHFNVTHITQNISDLLERAGCSDIIHLHGLITKAALINDPLTTIPWEGDINIGDSYNNIQLRPNVVLFDETVQNVDKAITTIVESDIIVVVGTSLNIFPAAGLLNYAPHEAFYIIDPNPPKIQYDFEPFFIRENATTGTEILLERLKQFWGNVDE